jgi:hypothetical protein
MSSGLGKSRQGAWALRHGPLLGRGGDWLRAYGWRLVEDVDCEELGGSYVAPIGRTRAAMTVERLVQAENQ